MGKNNIVDESFFLIRKDLQLDEENFSVEENATLDDLKRELIKIVRYLLDNDFNRLLNALYRIDVSEQKVNNIIEKTPPDEIANTLAEAILKREMKKVEYRIKYSP